MYAIVITTEENETAYWIGGTIFSSFPEEAAQFQTEVDAENTIPVLSKGLLNPNHSMRVVRLTE